MGHCEMLLAVAGLDQKALEERTRLLASRDWGSLPAGDRAAFFFAKKFSKTPWAIDDEDRNRLIAHFGRERALDVDLVGQPVSLHDPRGRRLSAPSRARKRLRPAALFIPPRRGAEVAVASARTAKEGQARTRLGERLLRAHRHGFVAPILLLETRPSAN